MGTPHIKCIYQEGGHCTYFLGRVPIGREVRWTPHILSEQGANRGVDNAHQTVKLLKKDVLWVVDGWRVGGFMRIRPHCGSILQAETSKYSQIS